MIRKLLFMLVVALPACDLPAQIGERLTLGGEVETDRALPPEAFEAVRQAMEATEAARALLAADRVDGLDEVGERIVRSLGAAAEAVEDAQLRGTLERGVSVGQALGAARELDSARASYGELSEVLFAAATVEPSLQAGWHVHSCPMVEGFGRWFQRAEARENPYMGPSMLTCGADAAWETELPATVEAHDPDEIAYWTCSMHPSVKSDEPGTCPICSMDLTPVTHGSIETGRVLIDAVRRQEIGVRTAPVTRGTLSTPVRAVGVVRYDQEALTDVSLRVEGWVERVYVDEPGQPVRRGQPLLAVYSPDLYATQEDLLRAEEADMSRLAEAARRRLMLWGLTAGQIDAIVNSGEARSAMDILSPASGFVVNKDVVEGDHVLPGRELYRIAGLDKVWVEAEVYEHDLARVRVGQPATVTVPGLDGQSFEADVSRVVPYLQGQTRTGRVRLVLDNAEIALKPDMYADVALHVDRGERLLVPQEAVLYAGKRRIVFVDRGEGQLQPVDVVLGMRGDGAYEVISGLSEGDVVVTSGNFLIAAESRLRSATGYWGGTDGPE